jgi:hypothetical protein
MLGYAYCRKWLTCLRIPERDRVVSSKGQQLQPAFIPVRSRRVAIAAYGVEFRRDVHARPCALMLRFHV